jgi:hypothetical protein
LAARVGRGPALCTLAAIATLLSALAALAASAAAATDASGAWSFASNPSLSPPSIAVTRGRSTQAGGKDASPEYLFLSPIPDYAIHKPFAGKPGPEILEADGQPVWQDPLGGPVKVGNVTRAEVAMDFHADTYEGRPVLVWWQGYITPQGLGNGVWKVVNQHYQTIATVHAPAGYETDFHVFQITPTGRAYIVANRVVPISLTCCGGPAKASIDDQVVLEFDLKTGKVVWRWDALSHVRLRESYTRPVGGYIWDPYHLNSLTVGPGGNLVIGMRNTWAGYWVYRVQRSSIGRIFATLGGMHSTFSLGSGVRFAWQHDIKYVPGQKVSVFADEAAPAEASQSRGEVVALDWARHAARMVHQYFLPASTTPKLAGSQGSVQKLADANVFIGWGQLPYFSEYTYAGKLVYMASLPGPDESYRAYTGTWTGLPEGPPQVAAQPGQRGASAEVYASWNGATLVASWQLLAGASPTALSASGQPVTRRGFETEIAASNRGPYYAVQALDAQGEVLGTSNAITASG